jgi:hypothetical protein
MSPSPTASSNRRDSYRRKSKKDVRISCARGHAGDGPDLALSLLDASQTGIRLIVREELDREQVVLLRLEGPGCPPVRRAGTIMWCVPAADGAFLVGVRLEERLPFAALIRLTEM